jgi:hypothetical protein
VKSKKRKWQWLRGVALEDAEELHKNAAGRLEGAAEVTRFNTRHHGYSVICMDSESQYSYEQRTFVA